MKILPTLPNMENIASINSFPIRDQSPASVTGEKSLLYLMDLLCLMDLLIAAAACVSDVTSSGVALTVVVSSIDADAVDVDAMTTLNSVLLKVLFVARSDSMLCVCVVFRYSI